MANTPPLYGFLDTPQAGATVPVTGAVLSGWVFNLSRGGQQPYSLRVRRAEASGGVVDVEIAARVNAIERPDVQTAFGVAINRFTGFSVTLGTIPAGRQTLVVEWADAYGAHYDEVEIVAA